MHSQDVLNKVNKSTAKNNRIDRDVAMNPREFDVGMDDEDIDLFYQEDESNTDFESGKTYNTGNFSSQQNFNTGMGFGSNSNPMQFNGQMGNPIQFNGQMGSPIGQNAFNPFQANQPQNQNTVQQKSGDDIEDIIGAILKKVVLWLPIFFKSLASSFKGLKARFWTRLGAKVLCISAGYILLGIILLFFKNSESMIFIQSGLVSSIIGVALLMFLYDRAREEDLSDNSEPEVKPYENKTINLDDDLENENYEDDYEDYEDEDYEDYEEYEDNKESVNDSGSKESVFSCTLSTDLFDTNWEEELDKLEVPTEGMYTRQYLYEKIMPMLMTKNRNYDIFEEIDEDDDRFDAFNSIIVTAAEQISVGKEDLPYLISASENLLFIKLDIKRTKSIKNVDLLCNEIVNIFRVDESKGIIPESNEGIYANYLTVGDKIIIKVYKGEETMITLRDIVENNKEFILDQSNKMPCVLGVDGNGQAVFRDLKDIESMLVTGFPRSGKTWFVLLLVTQLCMWNSPRDINIYILDPKDKISDFKNIYLPHITKFVTTDEEIVDTLRFLVRTEAKRRSGIIGGADKVNIWDFKKANPDIDLPIIYVVIDEVVSLASRMDKDTKSEFQGYLRELVTQLPATGVRAIFIPHEIKNDIINKTTTNAIAFRVSVMGNAAHIKQNIGINNFPHLLKKRGDLAIQLPDCDPKFMRAAVLSDSDDKNQEFFRFLRKLWTKLEPDCIKGSRAENGENKEKIGKLIAEDAEKDINKTFDFFNSKE